VWKFERSFASGIFSKYRTTENFYRAQVSANRSSQLFSAGCSCSHSVSALTTLFVSAQDRELFWQAALPLRFLTNADVRSLVKPMKHFDRTSLSVRNSLFDPQREQHSFAVGHVSSRGSTELRPLLKVCITAGLPQ